MTKDMIIRKAQFLISSPTLALCPQGDVPEFAFIGRSNVGKSSLINMLCNNGSLAKTSSLPGKTQLINYFSVNDNRWYLVDLPGYGYAKVPQKLREQWQRNIREYLVRRMQLMCTLVLIDSRLSPQAIDLDFIDWLGQQQLAFALVFTKADKNSATVTNDNIQQFQTAMLQTWDELPPIFTTSAVKTTGKTELLNYIQSILDTNHEQTL